jgi:hypothetical protein
VNATETATTPSTPKPSVSLAEYLWLHMAGLYGHRWTSSYGEDPRSAGGKQWALTLAGFTRAQIDTGLEACRATGEEWPPSAPQFKARCLGIPTFAQVKADLGRREHGFTRMVWQCLDHWLFSRAETRDAERQLRNAYDFAVERRMCGDEFPVKPAGELTHEKPEFKPATPEAAQQHMDACRELLEGGAYADPGIEVGGTTHGREVPLSEVERELAEHYARSEAGEEVSHA